MIDLSFVTNVITSLFCAAVLVQTVRLSRAVHKLRHAGLIEVVASLETATETSQQALSELTRVLTAEGPPLDAAVRGARDLRAQLIALRDELSLMIDIGNGVAERILAATNGTRAAPPTTADENGAENGTESGVSGDVAPTPRPRHEAPRERSGDDVKPSSTVTTSNRTNPVRVLYGPDRVKLPALVSDPFAPLPTAERVSASQGMHERTDGPFAAVAKESQS